MIQLEINDRCERVLPDSGKALRELIERALPAGHVITRLRVDGRDLDAEQLGELEPARLREVRVLSASPQQIARASLPETIDWLGRICASLENIARDYRTGREIDAARDLVDAIDALHVLAALLGSIHRFLDVSGAHRAGFEREWSEAERALHGATLELQADLESGDPVRLADRTGWVLPAALRRFAVLLEEIAS
jgi:hypothetical protein